MYEGGADIVVTESDEIKLLVFDHPDHKTNRSSFFIMSVHRRGGKEKKRDLGLQIWTPGEVCTNV
jgi:hypothetical protein